MSRVGFFAAVLIGLIACPLQANLAVAKDTPGADLLSPSDREIYRQALRKAGRKRFARALELVRRARDPLLAKVVLWMELSEPEARGSFPIVATFLDRNPDWPKRAATQLHAERIMPADMPDERILAWFAGHPPLTPEGAVRYALALMRAGERERATALLRATWAERRFTRRAEGDFYRRFRDILRPQDHRARLDRLLNERRSRAAKRQARRLGGGYPALTVARLALARERGGVDGAIRRIPESLKNDPGLIYERIRWRLRRGRYDGVVELLDRPRLDIARPERWWPLRQWAVRQALLRGDISVAYRIASDHGMDAGLGFAEAEWLAGWIALRFLAQPETAFRHFTRMHEGVSSPISLARGAFWSGEAARELAAGDGAGHWDSVARRWYATAAEHDTSFYGQLASQRLGTAPETNLEARGMPDAEARALFDAKELVRVVRMLGEIGETKLQERFLLRLKFLAETAQDYALVAELANQQGRPDMAMRTARAARGEGLILPGHLFPSLPLPGAQIPERALLLALIRQESGFYPAAVSPAGARGLMQVMPRTARQVARRIRVAYSKSKLLSDPEYNILLGRAYLANLLERYSGSYVLALAAYNAGPRNTGRWVEAFGDPRDADVDPVDWIESIPLDETRNYIQRILEGLVVYRQLLGEVERRPREPRLIPIAARAEAAPPAVNLSCCL